MKELKRPAWTPNLSKVAAGLAIGLAAAGLIYAAAATAAGIIADSFTTRETASHERAVEFDHALARGRGAP
jgi:hypothetical protein